MHSNYYSIELDHFSGFGLVNQLRNKQYLAQIYTYKKHNIVWNVEIPVTEEFQIFKKVYKNYVQYMYTYHWLNIFHYNYIIKTSIKVIS